MDPPQLSSTKIAFSALGAIAIVALTSGLGSYFTNEGVKSDWYEKIKAKETPPNWVFPVVWSILYILIAIALTRAFMYDNVPLVIMFIFNLTLNVIWCYAYFKQRKPVAGLAVITLILITVVALMSIAYISGDFITVALLVPYLAWLSFATFLNARTI